MSTPLRFTVLGPLRARRDGDDLRLGSPQQRALLAMLVLARGRPIGLDELVDGLWGTGSPASSVAVVRTYAARLRKVLEPDRPGGRPCGVLLSAGDGYALDLPPDAVDLTQVETLLARAGQMREDGRVSVARDLLAEALRAWSGVPLSGLPGPYAERKRTQLEELRFTALEARLDADVRLGRAATAINELVDLTAAYPLRERLCELLMIALSQAGRRADALEVFAQTQRILADELGIDPGPELREAHRRVLGAPARPAGSRARAGDDAVPAGGSGAPIPAQLPAPAPDVVERPGAERDLLAQLTAGGGGPVAVGVFGMAGVGKTTVALRVAHLIRDRFPAGQLYADLRGSGDEPADPGAVLAGFLRALGASDHVIPADLDERAALFRSMTATRRLIVLLDDAADAGQIDLLRPGGTDAAMLVTARRRQPGVAGQRLDVFGVDEALALVGRIAGADRVASDPDAARRLVLRCGLLPLAVRIAATRLADGHRSVAASADRLADGRRRLAELRTAGLDVASTLRRELTRLDAGAAHTLALLAPAEGPRVSRPAVAALLGVSDEVAEDRVEVLIEQQVLNWRAGGVHLHPLVRDVARADPTAPAPIGERRAAAERLAGFHLESARHAVRAVEPASAAPEHVTATSVSGLTFADSGQARRWQLDEGPGALASTGYAVRELGLDVQAYADLVLLLSRLPDLGGGVEALEEGASSVARRAAGSGNARAGARAHAVLAGLALRRRDLAPTRDHAVRAIACAGDAGDLRMLELGRSVLGLAHLAGARADAAVSCFESALSLAERGADQQRYAMVLGNLASAHRDRGRTGQAVELSRRARALAVRIGDPVATLSTGQSLARALLEAGRGIEAGSYVEEGIRLAEALGFRHWAVTGATLRGRLPARSGRQQPDSQDHQTRRKGGRPEPDQHDRAVRAGAALAG